MIACCRSWLVKVVDAHLVRRSIRIQLSNALVLIWLRASMSCVLWSLHPVLIENSALQMLWRYQSLMSAFGVWSLLGSDSAARWLVDWVWTHRPVSCSLTTSDLVVAAWEFIQHGLLWCSSRSQAIWFTWFVIGGLVHNIWFRAGVASSGLVSLLFDTWVSVSRPSSIWLLGVIWIICSLSFDFWAGLGILNRPLIITCVQTIIKSTWIQINWVSTFAMNLYRTRSIHHDLIWRWLLLCSLHIYF